MEVMEMNIFGIIGALVLVALKVAMTYGVANFLLDKLTNNWSGIGGFLAHFFCWVVALILVNPLLSFIHPYFYEIMASGNLSNSFFRVMLYGNPILFYPLLFWKFKKGNQNKWVARKLLLNKQLSNLLIFNVIVAVVGFTGIITSSGLFSTIVWNGLLLGYVYFTNRNNEWADFVEDKPLGDESLESGLF